MTEDGAMRLAVEPIYGSSLVAILIACVSLAVILMITPPTPNPHQRRWLLVLRGIATLAMLLAIWRPALLQTDQRPADAILVVAVDRSKSMTLPDGEGGDRWSAQQRAWRQLAEGLSGLDGSLSVRLLLYDDATEVIQDPSPTSLDQVQPDGRLTDLAAATLGTIQSAGGKPIAGVVLVGDGSQTAPVQGTGAQRVVETLNSLGVPLWCIPIGPAAGGQATRDVAIDALPESYQLFSGNEINVDFQVQLRGLAGVDVPVRVSWIDSQGSTEEVAIRRARGSKSDDVVALSIPLIVPSPGSYRLQVEAETQDGELVTLNNRQIAFADVREGGGRILYLEGELREEQSWINRSLRRFSDFDLTYRWVPPDTAAAWPVDFESWIRPGRFDVYIVGDLDAAALGDQQLARLAEAVREGAGLVTLGGYQTYGRGGYAETALADVLPVEMDRSRRSRPDSERTANQLPGPLAVRLARAHPITDLGGEDPAQIWGQLPPLKGANRWVGAKVAPGVQVLLESPEGAPLLVIGEYGKGRIASLAVDSTYVWLRSGSRDAHKRFWRQLILWLLAREDTGGDQIKIELDSRRFDVARPAGFRAGVQTLRESPVRTELILEAVDETGQVSPLEVSSDATGSWTSAVRGQLPELVPGFYHLRARPKDPRSPLEPEEVAFQVVDQSRELDRPMADPVYLQQLAQLTADFGGDAFATSEIASLLDVIAQRRRQSETAVVEKYRLGDGPISGWILFALFAGALSTEWLLRRRWGIV